MHIVKFVFKARMLNPNPKHVYNAGAEELEEVLAKTVETNVAGFYLDITSKQGMFQKDFFPEGFTCMVHVRKVGLLGMIFYTIRRFFESVPPLNDLPYNLADCRQSDSKDQAA